MTYKIHGMEVSPDVYAETMAQFPDSVQPKPSPSRPKQKSQEESPLSIKFRELWDDSDGPELQREFHFHPTRKWRSDFYHVRSRTIIEIEGGIYSGGRHVRGNGYAEDCFKYNAATMMGFNVIRLTQKQINADYIKELIQWAKNE